MDQDQAIEMGLMEKTVEGQTRLTSKGEDYFNALDDPHEAYHTWLQERLTKREALLSFCLGAFMGMTKLAKGKVKQQIEDKIVEIKAELAEKAPC